MNRIPKKIHYCWFGRGEMPELDKKCIESWHKYCTDYEFILWNEDNFDINCCTYVKQAYEARKFAFVADYVRLWALKEYGGFYMDTDTELIKPIDDFIEQEAVICYESETSLSCGLIGSVKDGKWISAIFDSYEGREFVNPDGSYDLTTIPSVTTKITSDFNWSPKLTSKAEFIEGVVSIYPFDYFCTMDVHTKKICRSKRSYAIHHYNASWVDNRDSSVTLKKRILCMMITVLGYYGFCRTIGVWNKLKHKS